MNKITAVFSTSFSLGRSLFTLESDSKKITPEGADSLISLAKENNLKSIFLLEDSFVCFKKAMEAFTKIDCQLIYGIRFNICNNNQEPDPKIKDESAHKISIFAKNDAGCKALMKLYSHVQTKCGGFLDYQLLKEKYSDDLLIVIQFYDSFIHRNSLFGKKCVPDLSFCSPLVWVADHDLPFDEILKQKTLDFANRNGYNIQEVHHVSYKHSADVEAMQVLKILTNRKGGKNQTLDKPELDGMGSNTFSWESYKEKSLGDPNP